MTSSYLKFDRATKKVVRDDSDLSTLKNPATVASSARIELLRKLTNTPLNNRNTIGYHGASLRALSYFLDYGVFPDSVTEGSRLWYFMPLPSTLNISDLSCKISLDDKFALSDAKIYAKAAAETTLLMKLLGVNGKDAYHICLYLTSAMNVAELKGIFRRHNDFFEKHNLSEERVMENSKSVIGGDYSQVKGVIFGVHQAIYSRFQVKEAPITGRFKDDGFCINAQKWSSSFNHYFHSCCWFMGERRIGTIV